MQARIRPVLARRSRRRSNCLYTLYGRSNRLEQENTPIVSIGCMLAPSKISHRGEPVVCAHVPVCHPASMRMKCSMFGSARVGLKELESPDLGQQASGGKQDWVTHWLGDWGDPRGREARRANRRMHWQEAGQARWSRRTRTGVATGRWHDE